MKILFNCPSLNKGGAERVICTLANEFIKNNNEVSIVTLINSQPAYRLDSHIKVFHIDKKKILNKGVLRTLYRFSPHRMWRLKRIVTSEKPDIILSFLPESCLRIMLMKRLGLIKIPVIISIRNDPNTEFKKLSRRFAMEKLYPRAEGFVFQTKKAKEFFENILNVQEQQKIIENPINREFLLSKPYVGQRKKQIVSVGRLEPQKNHQLLINAFSEVHKYSPEYELIIYGEGSLRKELESQIKKIGLEDFVFLPGQTDVLTEKIIKATCFVLSSDYEGMPNALMEAMALGIPCIATDCPCGGPRELINNNASGLLVPAGEVKELQGAILKVIKDPSLQKKLSTNGMKIAKELSPDIIAKKWLQFINEVIGAKI